MAVVSVRTWVVAVALASALVMLPRRWPVGASAAQETVAAATAAAAEQAAAAAALTTTKPKCQPGAATGPCRVGAVHDPENQEEEGLFSLKARAPADSNDDYSDADLPHDDDLVVLGH
ncbi:hypothetical protein GUJ93_ZPchr0006g42127 [Zizania palustris]|uniref:Secreted protein n=1 Tax=Zizania palustris TaxID=103762 RepID=A0A8J5TBC9_ZIZPA|nr:hypothetical protein GUJ93_ZPchr0006g42127 [Zizania palustris]